MVAALYAPAMRSSQRISQAAARYTPAGGREKCGACRHFVSQGACTRIMGPVSPRGWCKLFSQQVQWHSGGVLGSGSGVANDASLDISFMSAPLDPRITFTRGSVATYFDSTGTMQTVSGNTPRFDNDPVTHLPLGLLIEEARTNVLLNSATLGTQSVAVTAQAYTLSFYGTGTITKSGTASGALVGTGVFPQRVSQTFTPTAGTLTLTVIGSVLNAQLEAGSFVTSWIPTTAAAVTRAIDQCLIPPANMGFFVSPGGSWTAEFIAQNPAPSGSSRIVAWPNSAGQSAALYGTTARALAQYDTVINPISANVYSTNVVSKAASTLGASSGSVCLNGGAVATQSAVTVGYPAFVTVGIAFLTPNTATGENSPGYIRRVRYWPRVLSNTELQSVTT